MFHQPFQSTLGTPGLEFGVKLATVPKREEKQVAALKKLAIFNKDMCPCCRTKMFQKKTDIVVCSACGRLVCQTCRRSQLPNKTIGSVAEMIYVCNICIQELEKGK